MAAYLAVTFGMAFHFGRSRHGEGIEGYFLAGRALPWYLVGLSFYASNMSGASFVGLIGASYSNGLSVFHYEWTAAFVLAIFALFILPVFLRNRISTVPEYLELRFDRRTRVTYSVFTLVTLLFIDTAGALYAGAIVLQTGLPGLDLWMASIAISLLAGAYTIFGGLRAVVITDAVQSVVLIAGAIVVAAYGLNAVGGWEGLAGKLEPQMLQAFPPSDDAFMPWPGILGVMILGFYYWTFNQYFVQRALGSRSLDDGRKGALFAGCLKLSNLFLMILPGLIAAALYPGLASPDQAFPTLAFEMLPAGLRGIVLAAMLAAIMSSLDSALNAGASLLTLDLLKPALPRISEVGLLRIGRLTTAVIMVVAALYAPLIAGFGSLFEYFQATLAYLVSPIVAVYFGGLFIRSLTRESAFWTLVIIEPLALLLFLAKETTNVWSGAGLPDLHFTFMAVLLLLMTLAMMGLVTLFSGARWKCGQAAPGALASLADIGPDSPAQSGTLKDYRVQAGLLLGGTGLMLVLLATTV